MMKESHVAAYLALFLSQVTVGVNIVCSKILVQTISPAVILSARFAIGAVLLLVFHYLFAKKERRSVRAQLSKLDRRDWLYMTLQGLCAGAFFNIFILFGLHFEDASVAGIVTSSLPALVVLFSIVFLRERPGVYGYLCIAVAVAGLVVLNLHNILSSSLHGFMGMTLFCIAMIPEATYYILAKVYHHKLPVFLASAILNAISVPVLIVITLFMGHEVWPTGNLDQLLLLLTIGFSGGVFYVLWFLGCKHISSTAAGLCTAFMPVATLAIAYLVLSETISWVQALGMVLVLASIGFNGLGSYLRRHKK